MVELRQAPQLRGICIPTPKEERLGLEVAFAWRWSLSHLPAETCEGSLHAWDWNWKGTSKVGHFVGLCQQFSSTSHADKQPPHWWRNASSHRRCAYAQLASGDDCQDRWRPIARYEAPWRGRFAGQIAENPKHRHQSQQRSQQVTGQRCRESPTGDCVVGFQWPSKRHAAYSGARIEPS